MGTEGAQSLAPPSLFWIPRVMMAEKEAASRHQKALEESARGGLLLLEPHSSCVCLSQALATVTCVSWSVKSDNNAFLHHVAIPPFILSCKYLTVSGSPYIVNSATCRTSAWSSRKGRRDGKHLHKCT